jgi:hypothetical protein
MADSIRRANRFLGAVIGFFLMIGCSANSPTSTLRTDEMNGTGYLQGKVTIGPICPVETEGDPCLPDPALYTTHKLVILTDQGGVVKEVDMDGNGNYRTELLSGSYKVDFTPHDIGLPGSFEPPSVEIRKGQTTELNIEIDTGIR